MQKKCRVNHLEMIRTQRGRVSLTLGETTVNRENMVIRNMTRPDTPVQERSLIYSAEFTYTAPYFVHLYREREDPYVLRRWWHYPVEPRHIMVRNFNRESAIGPYAVDATVGTEAYRYWLSQMKENMQPGVEISVNVFSLSIAFVIHTADCLYALRLRRIR